MRYNIWSITHCCWRRTWLTERATQWDTISGASDIAVGGECHRPDGATTGLGQARTDFPRGYVPCGFWRAHQPGSHTELSPPDRSLPEGLVCPLPASPAKEVMGMLSALQKSPHATICFLSSKMWAQKNRTVDYLEREAPDRDALIQFAITRGRKLRQVRRVKQWDIQAELSACIATKLQEKETCGCSGLQYVNAWTRDGRHIRWACPLLISAPVMSWSWHLWLSHQPLMIKKTLFHMTIKAGL